VLKGKKEAIERKERRNQNKVTQIKSYKSRKGIFHVEATRVCLLLLPSTSS
jgi:hypothetical protein